MQRLFLGRLDRKQRSALRRVARAADATGVRVLLVGGAVRDLLLGRPIVDLDLTVEGDARRLARQLGGGLRVHRTFGTASVELQGVRVDLATTRRESYARPAALPTVSPGNLAQDLARRDFTINTLAAPLTGAGLAGVIDPFRGLEDLKKRRVRALHDDSFVDDPTRILRALRQSAELGFSLERGTARLIRRDRTFIELLSSARLRREVQRLCETRELAAGFESMQRFGLLQLLAPLGGAGRLPLRELGRLPRLRSEIDEPLASWVVPLALLMRTATPGQLAAMLDRLAPDRGSRRAATDAHRALRQLPARLRERGVRSRPSRIYAACRGYGPEALLAVLAAEESVSSRKAIRLYLERLRHVRADIDGGDLLRAGLAEGPAVARGLSAALAAKLDGRARTRRSQLAVARREGGRS
jgi:tRNA nucleotidyltransferase (CCA-adding enzyme)